jgi:hypothetical protein
MLAMIGMRAQGAAALRSPSGVGFRRASAPGGGNRPATAVEG